MFLDAKCYGMLNTDFTWKVCKWLVATQGTLSAWAEALPIWWWSQTERVPSRTFWLYPTSRFLFPILVKVTTIHLVNHCRNLAIIQDSFSLNSHSCHWFMPKIWTFISSSAVTTLFWAFFSPLGNSSTAFLLVTFLKKKRKLDHFIPLPKSLYTDFPNTSLKLEPTSPTLIYAPAVISDGATPRPFPPWGPFICSLLYLPPASAQPGSSFPKSSQNPLADHYLSSRSLPL